MQDILYYGLKVPGKHEEKKLINAWSGVLWVVVYAPLWVYTAFTAYKEVDD